MVGNKLRVDNESHWEFVIVRILELEESHSKARTSSSVKLNVINYLRKTYDLGESKRKS